MIVNITQEDIDRTEGRSVVRVFIDKFGGDLDYVLTRSCSLNGKVFLMPPVFSQWIDDWCQSNKYPITFTMKR